MRESFLFLLLLVLLSCGEKKTNNNDIDVIKYSSSDGTIELVNPFVRPAAKGMNSALFVKIKNQSDYEDTLYYAKSDIAELVEVHETYRVSEDKMGMRHVELVIIPARSEVLLKPKSYHVMLIDLVKDIPVKSEVKAALLFKRAGEIEISAPVKDINNTK